MTATETTTRESTSALRKEMLESGKDYARDGQEYDRQRAMDTEKAFAVAYDKSEVEYSNGGEFDETINDYKVAWNNMRQAQHVSALECFTA